MHIWELYPGKIVEYNGEVARVEKRGNKYPVILLEDGRRYRVSPSSLATTTKGFKVAGGEATGLVLGTVVRYKKNGKVYVITGSSGVTYRMALLGGDGGNYVTGVSPSMLENVDLNLEVE